MKCDDKCCRGCGTQNNTKTNSWTKLQHVEKKTPKKEEELFNSLIINEFEHSSPSMVGVPKRTVLFNIQWTPSLEHVET